VVDGRVHLGVKIQFELYPKLLRDRLCKERRESRWDTASREAIALASKALEDFDTDHPNPNQASHLMCCLATSSGHSFCFTFFRVFCIVLYVCFTNIYSCTLLINRNKKTGVKIVV